MNKYSLITTYYTFNSSCPSTADVKSKFNYDGDVEHLYINFSDQFDPWHKDHLNVGESGRRDLVYGKIFLLKEFIEKYILNKYEYLCHVDFSDIKFARSFIEMMDNFKEEKQDFIISTEKICWPFLQHMQKITENSSLQEEEFTYVNSGAIISKTDIFYNYLLQLIDLCLHSKLDFWDDQGVWQYFHIAISKLNTDNTCKYFFSTGMLDNTYYYIKNNKIFTKFNTQPYIIHDNSSFSLNLTRTI